MYGNKMEKSIHDKRLIIYFFNESLSSATLSWYIHLDNNEIIRWKDLVDAFIRQYKFNMDATPNRSSLQTMEKGNIKFIQ
jgi:hypothetical protein